MTQKEFLVHDFSHLNKGKTLVNAQDRNGEVDIEGLNKMENIRVI